MVRRHIDSWNFERLKGVGNYFNEVHHRGLFDDFMQRRRIRVDHEFERARAKMSTLELLFGQLSYGHGDGSGYGAGDGYGAGNG